MAEKSELVIQTETLKEMLAAVEGYRGQLSNFGDQALAEIDQLKFWIQKAIADGAAQVALAEVLPK
jgi:hypothetical protein